MTAKTDAPPLPDSYTTLAGILREVATITSAQALLSWDQETMMPPRGAAFRATQLATLSGLVHDRSTSPELGEMISAAEADPDVQADEALAASVREMRRDYDRAVRLPGSLVREMTEAFALGMEAWRSARERNDFAAFLPHLEKTVDLNRRAAEAYGVPEGGELYDALLEGYEPGMTAAEVDRVFSGLRADLAPLIHEIAEAATRPGDAFADRRLSIPDQQAFNRAVVERMGFDMEAGRLDVSTHPFCSGIAPGDTRLTSRYREDGFLDALSSTMHEGGHGMYEQGLPEQHFGAPLGEAAGLGIHESQSRMWENMVGRSRPFWEWALPQAKAAFPEQLGDVDLDAAFGAANVVQPTLIRVESDEATYNLHIMLRFDLERAMLKGDLAPADLPEAWNERIRSDLGIEVPDDRRGCLQDVHWSMGAIGYFPTYTLGNLYAAQLWAAAREELTDLDAGIAAGDFSPLLRWLRENIHQHGRRFPAPELCERVTQRPLSHDPLIGYLREKLTPLYGLG